MKLLHLLQPTVIGVEQTEEGFKDELTFEEMLSSAREFNITISSWMDIYPDANRETLRRFLAQSYTAPSGMTRYATSNRIPLVYCEHPGEAEKYVADAEQADFHDDPDLDMLHDVLCLDLEWARTHFRSIYGRDTYHVNPDIVESCSLRDAYAESRLRPLSGTIVHFGGLDHLFGEYHPNLADRLADLNPLLIRLHEADDIGKLRKRLGVS